MRQAKISSGKREMNQKQRIDRRIISPCSIGRSNPTMQSMASLLSSTRGTHAFTSNSARSHGLRLSSRRERSPCLLVRAENVLIINTKGRPFLSYPCTHHESAHELAHAHDLMSTLKRATSPILPTIPPFCIAFPGVRCFVTWLSNQVLQEEATQKLACT